MYRMIPFFQQAARLIGKVREVTNAEEARRDQLVALGLMEVSLDNNGKPSYQLTKIGASAKREFLKTNPLAEAR